MVVNIAKDAILPTTVVMEGIMKTKNIHARVTPKFYDEVLIFVKQNGYKNISDLMITSLIHEMYGRTEVDVARYELSVVRDVIDSRISELCPSDVTQNVTQSVDVTQSVAQNTNVAHDVAQNVVNLEQIKTIHDITNITIAIAIMKERTKYDKEQEEKFVTEVAKQCGYTLQEFNKIMRENDIDYVLV